MTASPSGSLDIAHIDVVCHLSESERIDLCGKAQPQSFARGDDLIREGDISDFILLIIRGEVEVIRTSNEHAAPLRLTAPLMSGEIAAYAGRPRMATVRACGPVDALRLERVDFLAAIRKSAAAGLALTELVAQRICAPASLKKIGRYTLERLAGRGGSGCVFAARDDTSGERIALKMLSHALALMPGAVEAFFREADMLGRMHHPGIIRVHDIFMDYDTCFIAMPWIDGASLRKCMDDGETVTAEEIRTWTCQLLEALEVLHLQGMAHCDIKPSNILVDGQRRAVLIDLGAGCFLGDRTRSASQFNGSPLYASPEQIMGRAPDGRSDIYALCCTLYELILGHPPFNGDTMEDIMNAHLRGTPSFNAADQSAWMDTAYMSWLKQGLKRGRNGRPDATMSLKILRGTR